MSDDDDDYVQGTLRGRYKKYYGQDVILFKAKFKQKGALPIHLLSNLAIVESGVTYEGITYPSVEHAYQAQKFSRRTREMFSVHGPYGNPEDNFHAGWTKYFNAITPRGDNAKKIADYKNKDYQKSKQNTMGVLAKMVNTQTRATKSRKKPFTEALGLELDKNWDFNGTHEQLWLKLLRSKYEDPFMQDLLLSTGDAYLIEFQNVEKMFEENEEGKKVKTDRDYIDFYTAYYDKDKKMCKHCNEPTCNAMGKFLMKIRDEIRRIPESEATLEEVSDASTLIDGSKSKGGRTKRGRRKRIKTRTKSF
jgi:predicted NAD-dependent protein-ADP-ribosyltransferase YbiA (DUF1768 family)